MPYQQEAVMVRGLRGIVWGVALVALTAAPALADIGSDDGPGCGLGKLAWSGAQGKNRIAQQVLASTTNGTFGAQTFGISFGTSGCTNDGQIASNQKVNVFAEVNLNNLRQEMAQGHGEYLASLATLIGIPNAEHPQFFALTQQAYGAIFASEATTPQEMLVSLNTAMAADQEMAQYQR
jgi:hypothetical protein